MRDQTAQYETGSVRTCRNPAVGLTRGGIASHIVDDIDVDLLPSGCTACTQETMGEYAESCQKRFTLSFVRANLPKTKMQTQETPYCPFPVQPHYPEQRKSL